MKRFFQRLGIGFAWLVMIAMAIVSVAGITVVLLFAFEDPTLLVLFVPFLGVAVALLARRRMTTTVAPSADFTRVDAWEARADRGLRFLAYAAELFVLAACAWILAAVFQRADYFLVALGVLGVISWVVILMASDAHRKRFVSSLEALSDGFTKLELRVAFVGDWISPIARVFGPITRLIGRPMGFVLRGIVKTTRAGFELVDEPVRTIRQTYSALPELARAGLDVDAATNEAGGRVAGWALRITLAGARPRVEVIGLPMRARIEDVQELVDVLKPDDLRVRVGRAFAGVNADARDPASAAAILDQVVRMIALAEALSRRSAIAKLKELAREGKPMLRRAAIRVLEARGEIPADLAFDGDDFVRLAWAVRAKDAVLPEDGLDWVVRCYYEAESADVRLDAIRGLARWAGTDRIPEMRRLAAASATERQAVENAITSIRARDQSAGAGQLTIAAETPAGGLSMARGAGSLAIAKRDRE